MTTAAATEVRISDQLQPDTIEGVLSRVGWSKHRDNPRFLEACAEAAKHVRAMTFSGNAYERKLALLREGLRFRDDWLAKA